MVTKVMMPEMGGYEFMRAHTKEADTPVVILTAKLEETDKEQRHYAQMQEHENDSALKRERIIRSVLEDMRHEVDVSLNRASDLEDRMSLDAPGVGADEHVPKKDTRRDRWLCALYGLIRHTILWFVANGRAMLYESYRTNQDFEREGWRAGYSQEIEEVIRATTK